MPDRTFKKGDRVVFRTLTGRLTDAGTVLEDSVGDVTWVQYDKMGVRSASSTSMLEYHTSLSAETQSRSFCVEIPDPAKFLKISEGTALDEELMRAGAFAVEANGHYGSAYFFSLQEGDVPNVGRFLQIIERHLALLEIMDA